jgi:3-dehydroquinate synthase
MILKMDLPGNEYDIVIERGAISCADKYMDLQRKVLIVTDSGVPREYSNAVAACCKYPIPVAVPEGEATKDWKYVSMLCKLMLDAGFTRDDCVVAVGGGVCGDLSGFAASIYMRGIDFYNIPTTVLSQVDSSIGGKVAVDFFGVKNIIGSFHQPRCVIVDPDTLKTLDKRQISNGLAEALKMSLTSDAELFRIFEEGRAEEEIDTVIERSLKIKKYVVEQDEKESGLRKILNFGHTLGHGIEACEGLSGLYHGECVALGMIPMCSETVRPRLMGALEYLSLPTKFDFDLECALEAASHDKKCSGGDISVIYVEEVGSCEIRKMPIDDWKNEIRKSLKV